MFVKAIFTSVDFGDKNIQKPTQQMFVNHYRSLNTFKMKQDFRSSGMQQTEKHNFKSSLK